LPSPALFAPPLPLSINQHSDETRPQSTLFTPDIYKSFCAPDSFSSHTLRTLLFPHITRIFDSKTCADTCYVAGSFPEILFGGAHVFLSSGRVKPPNDDCISATSDTDIRMAISSVQRLSALVHANHDAVDQQQLRRSSLATRRIYSRPAAAGFCLLTRHSCAAGPRNSFEASPWVWVVLFNFYVVEVMSFPALFCLVTVETASGKQLREAIMSQGIFSDLKFRSRQSNVQLLKSESVPLLRL